LVDYVDVGALAVRHDRCLREHRTLGLIHRYGATGECSRAQSRVRFQSHADLAQPGGGVDYRAEQAYTSLERTRQARDVNGGGLSNFEHGEILLGDLSAHFNFAVAGDAEQGVAAGACDLTHFGLADEQGTVDGREHARAAQACLIFGQLRRRHLDVGFVGHLGGVALFNVFSRQSSGWGNSLRPAILRSRERGLGTCLFQRGLEAVDLWNEYRLIELGQYLTPFDVIARLHIDRHDSPGIAVNANGHVVAG